MSINAFLIAAANLADSIETAREIADAREGDWEELCQTRHYLETLNESAEDSIPVEEMEQISADIRAARAAWEIADDKLQQLVTERAALSLRLDRARYKNRRALTGADYDRQQEREDREHAAAQAMQREPVTPWWLTVEV